MSVFTLERRETSKNLRRDISANLHFPQSVQRIRMQTLILPYIQQNQGIRQFGCSVRTPKILFHFDKDKEYSKFKISLLYFNLVISIRLHAVSR
jgi:hypothetical protein